MASTPDGAAAGGKKRKRTESPGLADLHDDMLERVLSRLPPSSYFRLRGVSRRWRAAAESRTFRAACASVTSRDPWFLMLSDPDNQDQDEEERRPRPAAVFDSAERGAWACWRGAPVGTMQPVASAGGLVLYRDAATGDLTVVNPLTGASRALPPTPTRTLQAVAMYGSPYRVVLILGELPDLLSTVVYDSSTNAWGDEAALSRMPPAAEEEDASSRVAEADGGDDDDDDTVYYLSKSGDVVATTIQRSAARQYSSAVACHGDAVLVYFLSRSGTVVSCDLARRAFAELPRILPAYHEYSIDVVACGGSGNAYAVVLSEFLDAPSLRVWEFAAGGVGWRQVAAMPPSMAYAFRGAKADVNCVGHGDRVMVCVSSGSGGGVGGCFLCDVRTNRWEELPRRDGVDAATGFVAALSFEPRMEAAV